LNQRDEIGKDNIGIGLSVRESNRYASSAQNEELETNLTTMSKKQIPSPPRSKSFTSALMYTRKNKSSSVRWEPTPRSQLNDLTARSSLPRLASSRNSPLKSRAAMKLAPLATDYIESSRDLQPWVVVTRPITGSGSKAPGGDQDT